MLMAVAVSYSTLPLRLIERHRLDEKVHERGGEREVQFHFRGAAVLPVWHEGQLRVVRWGCRRGESRFLPVGGWGGGRDRRDSSGAWARQRGLVRHQARHHRAAGAGRARGEAGLRRV